MNIYIPTKRNGATGIRIYQERASTHMVVQLTTVIISIPRGPGFGSLKFKTKRTAMMIREI